MEESLINYFFELHGQKTLLFKIPILLSTEKQCLDLYEKGLKKSYFKVDRSSITQHWAEISQWGFLGRCAPVDLLRTLCAHGGQIKASSDVFKETLMGKSYKPVHFQVCMNKDQYKSLQGVLSIKLGE